MTTDDSDAGVEEESKEMVDEEELDQLSVFF